jgi:hypothetical protein
MTLGDSVAGSLGITVVASWMAPLLLHSRIAPPTPTSGFPEQAGDGDFAPHQQERTIPHNPHPYYY